MSTATAIPVSANVESPPMSAVGMPVGETSNDQVLALNLCSLLKQIGLDKALEYIERPQTYQGFR